MRIQKDNKAVSPVIGIMLMLVVTVILAAAVSSSSSGLMKSTEKAPFAVFDVKVAKDTGDFMANSFITIRQVTGDAIQTKDLKIITTNPKATGTKTWEIKPSDAIKTHGNSSLMGLTPYWNNMGQFGFGSIDANFTSGNNVNVNFGNYTLKPGVVMTAQDGIVDNSFGTWNVTKYDDTGSVAQMKTMFADWDNVSKGDMVNVKLVHMPSSKVIFASDVEVI